MQASDGLCVPTLQECLQLQQLGAWHLDVLLPNLGHNITVGSAPNSVLAPGNDAERQCHNYMSGGRTSS